jgi:RNA polymerase sigma-70 factor (ECF subfamily)
MPPTPEQDRELVLRARKGDERALDELARAWRPFVLVVCRAHAAEQDVDDLTQQALVRFLCRLDAVNPQRPLAPWVGQVARNVCRDFYRQRREVFSLEGLAGEPAGEDGNLDAGPESSVLGSELGRDLDYCLSKLRPRSRMLVELHYLAEIPTGRLAEFWPEDVPRWKTKQTLSNWFKQAKEALRRCLEARGWGGER